MKHKSRQRHRPWSPCSRRPPFGEKSECDQLIFRKCKHVSREIEIISHPVYRRGLRGGEFRAEASRDDLLEEFARRHPGDGGWCNSFYFLRPRSRSRFHSQLRFTLLGKPISSPITLSMASFSIKVLCGLVLEKRIPFEEASDASVECSGSRPEPLGREATPRPTTGRRVGRHGYQSGPVIEAGLDSSVRIGAAFEKPLATGTVGRRRIAPSSGAPARISTGYFTRSPAPA